MSDESDESDEISESDKTVLAEVECTCDIGPGKFEGESAETFLAHALGDPDDELGSVQDFGHYERHDFPLRVEGTFEVDEAREYGYCDGCIADAIETFAGEGGIVVEENDQGFVTGTLFANRVKLDEAWSRLRDEAIEAAGPQDDDWTTESFTRFYKCGTYGRKREDTVVVIPDDCCWKCVLIHVMEQDRYWTNVWSVSDHGNVSLLRLDQKHEHE